MACEKNDSPSYRQLLIDACQPFPNSQKVYVTGSREDIRVGMREIHLNDTHERFGGGRNEPVRVYDTSGSYTETGIPHDLTKGLPGLRDRWIDEREDCEMLNGRTSEFARAREHDLRLEGIRFTALKTPRKAKPGKAVTQIHYARQGIITPEMEYIAIRENMGRKDDASHITPRVCQKGSGRRPSYYSCQYQPP